jgi:hypothetical protein
VGNTESGKRRLTVEEALGLTVALETDMTAIVYPPSEDQAVTLPGGQEVALPAAKGAYQPGVQSVWKHDRQAASIRTASPAANHGGIAGSTCIYMVSEGGLEPPCPKRALAPQASASAYSATRTCADHAVSAGRLTIAKLADPRRSAGPHSGGFRLPGRRLARRALPAVLARATMAR